MTQNNATWILRQRPEGMISTSDMELVQGTLAAPGDGFVCVRTLYISLDPANRIWVSDRESYIPPIEIDAPLHGSLVGVIEDAGTSGMEAGTVVMVGLAPWALYNNVPAVEVTPLPQFGDLPYHVYLGPLGPTGLTAYFGLMDVAEPKAGETIFVGAAAGAVGSMVGQIGKIQGCRVVGVAGDDDKCRWLVEKAGFDAAINYKTEDLDAALSKHCPDGIDINFENVGGEIMETVMDHLNHFARMPLCGLISTYNTVDPHTGPKNFVNFLMRRTRVQGFLILDYMDRFPEGQAKLAEWIASGQITFETDIVKGLENIPTGFERLFGGKNLGKLIVEVSEL